MNNHLYQSILSRISAVAPLFAKSVLERAVFRMGRTPENVSAIELLQILKTDINPKLSPTGFKSNVLAEVGSGFIIFDSFNKIIYMSPLIQKIVRVIGIKKEDLAVEFEKLEFCRPRTEVQIIVRTIKIKALQEIFEVSIVPLFDEQMRVIGTVTLVKEITLQLAIEDQVIYQSCQLKEEIRKKERAEEELRLNQTRMIETAKLAALGEMAGGISHEINNPLAVVSGGVEMIERLIDSGKIDRTKMKVNIERVKNAAFRIKSIIDAMRTLTREDNKEKKPKFMSLDKVISDVIALCRDKFRTLGVELSVTNNIPGVMLPFNQIELGQVFINVLNNAFDAVTELEDKWIKIYVNDLGDMISVSFVDSGKGIPTHVQEKMFEPFFTTKVVGKGVGLGMSISRRIMELHQGKILVDQKSPNTRIDVLLPKNPV